MKGDPEERAAAVGRYIVESGATVRAGLWAEVQAVVQRNKAERHLRGGEATRRKYLHTASCAAHGGTV